MAEEKKLNLTGLKGIDTSKPNGEPEVNPILKSAQDKITSSDDYIQPETKKQAFINDLASAGINGVTNDTVKGTNFMVDSIAKNLFTPFDLATAIPDPNERAEYIRQHGSKMTNLLDPNVYGILFNREIADYAAFRHQNYNKQLKKFVDDLDANQGFWESLGTTSAKLMGSTLNNIGANIIAPIYGIGSALYNWDRTKVFDNDVGEWFNKNQEYIDQHLVIYGGYDYAKKRNEQTFFSRLVDHPFKSINDDIVPTVSFVMGAVGAELILGKTGVKSVTGRFTKNLIRPGVYGTQKFAKAYRTIRGLDQLSDIESMRKVINATNTIQNTIGTLGTMYRSAAYESSMIGKDTQDTTLLQSKFGYIRNNPKLFNEYKDLVRQNMDEFGNLTISEEEIIEQIARKIPKGELAIMQNNAKNAGTAAFLTNIPLVGASYMIQFPKIFGSGYRANQKILSQSGILYGTTRTSSGKLVSNFSQASRLEKFLFKYAFPSAKVGFTEAFEEFSQGVIEKGYSDYWSAPYTKTSVDSSVSFLQAMSTAARKYAKSVEGIDSMTLGFLMGFMGIPMYKGRSSAKTRFGRWWSGGAYEAVSEVSEKISEVEAAVERYNEGIQTNEVLKNNFEAFRKSVSIQEDKDLALERGDVFAYKNAEHDEVFNYVINKIDNGILDTVYQDLDALEDMDLETFNEQFAHKDENFQFTEETKKKNLETFRKNVDSIVESQDTFETVFNDKRVWVDRFFSKDFKGLDQLEEFDPEKNLEIDEDQHDYARAKANFIRNKQNLLKEQGIYLLASSKNLQKREKELKERLNELVPNVNLDALYKDENYKEVLAAVEKGDHVFFAEEKGKKQLDSFINEILGQIKEDNFKEYNFNEQEIKSIVKDIFQIKTKQAKVSEIYSVLFTTKGANKWLQLKEDFDKQFEEALLEAAREAAQEDANNKQDASSLKTSLDSYRQLFGKEVPQHSKNIIKQLKNIRKNLSDPEAPIYEEVVDLLKKGKNTNLIEHIFELMESREQLPLNLEYSIDNIDQFKDNETFKNNFLDAFNTILNNYENIVEEIVKLNTNYADSKKENVTPEPKQTTEEFKKEKKEASTLDQLFEEVAQESRMGHIPTINEKDLIFDANNKLIGVNINSQTGKPYPWKDRDGNPTTQTEIDGYDMKKVNSSDWLNNKDLEQHQMMATFKFNTDLDSKGNSWGDKSVYDADNIGINVFHGDTFIGRLQKTASNPSVKSLREALYNGTENENGIIRGKIADEGYSTYEGYEATVAPKTETKETTTQDIEARKKKLGINKNVLRIDSVGTTGSMSTKVKIQTPDGGTVTIKPGTDSDLNFERVAPKGMYTRKNNDPYDVVTLQDNFDKINEKENLIPQKLVDILIKEADFKGKKQTLENPQYTDIQKKIFAVSDKANITLTPDYGPTKEYREEILDPLSEFTDLFLKEIYESEIERHKGYIADIKKKGDESEKKQISTREEYIAVYENELAALEQTTTPETEVEQSAREKIIEENFDDIIKQLRDMSDTVDILETVDNKIHYIGEKEC